MRYISRRSGKSSAQLIPILKGFPDLSVLVMRFGSIVKWILKGEWLFPNSSYLLVQRIYFKASKKAISIQRIARLLYFWSEDKISLGIGIPEIFGSVR
jgi:hypothetical protein